MYSQNCCRHHLFFFVVNLFTHLRTYCTSKSARIVSYVRTFVRCILFRFIAMCFYLALKSIIVWINRWVIVWWRDRMTCCLTPHDRRWLAWAWARSQSRTWTRWWHRIPTCGSSSGATASAASRASTRSSTAMTSTRWTSPRASLWCVVLHVTSTFVKTSVCGSVIDGRYWLFFVPFAA